MVTIETNPNGHWWLILMDASRSLSGSVSALGTDRGRTSCRRGRLLYAAAAEAAGRADGRQGRVPEQHQDAGEASASHATEPATGEAARQRAAGGHEGADGQPHGGQAIWRTTAPEGAGPAASD